jgi:hypothetical protein
MPKYNPFRPNSMVTPGMFAGRYNEMATIERGLFQTKHSNPKHFLVSGERGIGKSSLFLYVDGVAKGALQTFDDTTLNFLVLTVDLVGSTTYEDIVSGIANEFKAEVARRQKIKEFAKKAWEFITDWKVMGVEYKKERQGKGDDVALIDSLCDGISDFLKAVDDQVDGLLILIDEADRPAVEAKLGEFCKLFTEKLTKLGCDRVCLGLAGLPSLIANLRASHDSAPRLFDALSLEPLESSESETVVRRGLSEAEEKNKQKTEIDEEALAAIVRLSEGYPHFIQQFSYSAFDEDSDDRITVEDVNQGAFKENGALDQLGKRFFSELYFEKIASEDYRRVLNSMADHLDGWTTRAEIIRDSGVKSTQVTNALKALRERHIILTNEKKQGEYRLPTKSFAVWIKALNAKKQLASRPTSSRGHEGGGWLPGDHQYFAAMPCQVRGQLSDRLHRRLGVFSTHAPARSNPSVMLRNTRRSCLLL